MRWVLGLGIRVVQLLQFVLSVCVHALHDTTGAKSVLPIILVVCPATAAPCARPTHNTRCPCNHDPPSQQWQTDWGPVSWQVALPNTGRQWPNTGHQSRSGCRLRTAAGVSIWHRCTLNPSHWPTVLQHMDKMCAACMDKTCSVVPGHSPCGPSPLPARPASTSC
jgi:hypothetical protein